MFSQENLVHQVLVSRHQNCGVWCQNQVPQPLLWFVFFFTNLFVKRTWLQSAMTWDFHIYKNYESESWSQRQWSSVEPDLWACLFELDHNDNAMVSGYQKWSWIYELTNAQPLSHGHLIKSLGSLGQLGNEICGAITKFVTFLKESICENIE